jgi:hypothetical protein
MSINSFTKKKDLLDTSVRISLIQTFVNERMKAKVKLIISSQDINLIEQASVPKSKLKHHYAAIWLIVLYIPFIIAQWIITVILSYRPISKHQNTYHHPEGFTIEEYKQMQSWVTAVQVLSSIVNLLAVPVVSFVIAQAAVIFSQKRVPARQLSVHDIFALADRAWTDISVLFKLMRGKGHGSRAFNGFIALASGLLLISEFFRISLRRFIKSGAYQGRYVSFVNVFRFARALVPSFSGLEDYQCPFRIVGEKGFSINCFFHFLSSCIR